MRTWIHRFAGRSRRFTVGTSWWAKARRSTKSRHRESCARGLLEWLMVLVGGMMGVLCSLHCFAVPGLWSILCITGSLERQAAGRPAHERAEFIRACPFLGFLGSSPDNHAPNVELYWVKKRISPQRDGTNWLGEECHIERWCCAGDLYTFGAWQPTSSQPHAQRAQHHGKDTGGQLCGSRAPSTRLSHTSCKARMRGSTHLYL